jgi:hypothetical protein
MEHKAKSIRPFLAAKNFEVSRKFYLHLGFRESILSASMSYFETTGIGFYLQDAYVKAWADNTMVFMEVDDVHRFWKSLLSLDLTAEFEHVRLVPVRELEWGRECFLHDPSGILWHFGEFNNSQ